LKAELIDLSYAAGFIEADGCFHITNSGVGIRVANRNTWVLRWFEHTFGGSINSKVTPTNCWEWNLFGPAAKDLCKELLPHLKFKYNEAITLINFQDTVGPRGRKVNEATKEIRSMLRARLKEHRKVRSDAS
jgi:hypothetical protein